MKCSLDSEPSNTGCLGVFIPTVGGVNQMKFPSFLVWAAVIWAGSFDLLRSQDASTLAPILPFGLSTPGGAAHPLPGLVHVGTFEAESDFILETGRAQRAEAVASWRLDTPGFLLSGLNFESKRGIELPEGVYRWEFRIRRGDEPVQMNGSPLMRLSVFDVTTGELLVERSLASGDFDPPNTAGTRSLIHSTSGRSGHRFEPRVYWDGDVDAAVDSVTLQHVMGYSQEDLGAKVRAMEGLIEQAFLEPIPGSSRRGLVVSRSRNAIPIAESIEDQGNSALWTGHYVAAEAFRRMADPNDPAALQNLENGFRALHALHAVTRQPGIVARFTDADGNWRVFDPLEVRWKSGRLIVPKPPGTPFIEEWAKSVISEDAFTAFVFAVGIGYPQIQDAELKSLIADDIRAIARHFLSHDFGFETEGTRIDLNSYLGSTPDELSGFIDDFLDPSTGQLESALRLYRDFDQTRDHYNKLTSDSEILDVLSFGCLPAVDRIPDPFITDERALIDAMESRNAVALKLLLPRVLPDLYSRMFWMRDHLKKQLPKLREGFDCVGRFPGTNPGKKFRSVLAMGDKILASLEALLAQMPPTVDGIRDVRFHVAHALQAAQILAVARMVAPEEFSEPYRQALDGNSKKLRATLEQWGGVHREWATFLGGQLGFDQQRSVADQRSAIALISLVRLEPDPSLRATYRKLFESLRGSFAGECNAFFDAAREVVRSRQPGQTPTDLGVSWWSLALLPNANLGLARDTWQRLMDGMVEYGGGAVAGDAPLATRSRDPLPPTLFSGQPFRWRANPREMTFNTVGALRVSPSLDLILPYWMARSLGQDPQVPTPENGPGLPRILGAELIKTSGEVGLTIGTGTAIDGECRSRDGTLRAQPELASLPGPFGPQEVPVQGLNVGWTHVRMLNTDNQWKVTLNSQSDAVSWTTEVCRAGGIEKPGSEVRFLVDLVRPARRFSTPVPVVCPAQVVTNSGEQRASLSSGLFERSSSLSFRVDMPAAYQPLQGTPGRIDLNEQGYEDSSVKVTVTSYTRVQEFYMIRDATGLQIEARIRRPGGGGGGAEIVVQVELRTPRACPHTFAALPAKLVFNAMQGSVSDPRILQIQELQGRPAPFFASFNSEDGTPWLRIQQTSAVAPSALVLQASGILTQPRVDPYKGLIQVDFPGGEPSQVSIPVEFNVAPVASVLRPENDRIVNAALLEGREARASAPISGATLELGEPLLEESVVANSLWWKWRAPASGPVEVSTAGSTFDTVLAVHSGFAPGPLRVIAENDTVLPQSNASGLRFEAFAGEEYFFKVGGSDSSFGQVQLHLSMPAILNPGGRSVFPIQMLVVPGFDRYRIEASDDLILWRPVSTVLTTDSIIRFSDPTPASGAGRYYRARAL